MSFLDTILNKKSLSALGIDIGSSSIKVVQLKRKGDKAILETYGELSLGPYAGVEIGQSTNLSTEKISEALRDVLAEKEVAISTKTCGIAIPFKASLLSVLELPAVTPKELESMVPLEARKYIPVPMSEVTIDWSLIPKVENEEETLISSHDKKMKTIDVLLVAIHNNIINQYKDIVSQNALDARFFEIEVFSAIRAVLDNAASPVMVFDMGASTTKLYIIDRGVVVSSHTVSRGSQDITANIARNLGIQISEAEILKRTVGISVTNDGKDLKSSIDPIIENIFTEANRFLFDFQRKKNHNIKSVYLTGGGSALKGFREIAAEAFKVEVVSGNPFEKVETPAFLTEVLKQTGPEFAVAAGTALRCLSEL